MNSNSTKNMSSSAPSLNHPQTSNVSSNNSSSSSNRNRNISSQPGPMDLLYPRYLWVNRTTHSDVMSTATTTVVYQTRIKLGKEDRPLKYSNCPPSPTFPPKLKGIAL